ncbi:MAG: hypothetical protein HKN87_03030 [Saprospiraceae bacterium]|nr:hypothetical protein [Saprospiraceae bacterium]
MHNLFNVKLWLLVITMFANCVHAQVLRYSKGEPQTGKHYLFPEFQEGIIKLAAGQETTTLLNYNFITQEIIIDLGHTKAPYPGLEHVSKVVINDILLMPIEGIIYELLQDGASSLLVHRRQAVSRDGTSSQTGYGQSAATSSATLPPSLHNKELLYGLTLPGDYHLKMINKYFLMQDGKIVAWTKLKRIEKIFPKVKEELSRYIKENKIKMDKEEDLIDLFRYSLKISS